VSGAGREAVLSDVPSGAIRATCRALGLALLVLIASVRHAQATTSVHALVIGNNRPFEKSSASASESLPTLRYSDDDAAAFYDFVTQVSTSAELLTVMDAETQALYPRLVSSAKVPTLAAVSAAVSRLALRIRQEHAAGQRSMVFVFFSGHGAVDYQGQPALALFDGGLSHDFLYREILEKLPADEVHLLVDACHAEAVVRPRDGSAEVVNVSAEQANAFLIQSTLARFPHVGAILAATNSAEAHEWDAIRHGIFTHELLSALRGASDINHDRLIEYSEVYAFMAAANRQVADSRARLAVVVKPPEINRRAPLLSLSDFRQTSLAWLSGVPGQYGIIELDDARGRRLATLHGDHTFVADLLVPAGVTVYVRGGRKEASFRASPGQVVPFQRLRFVDTSVARGAVEDAVRRGLFAAEYGRSYYDGVVDQLPSLISVEFSDSRDSTPAPSRPNTMPRVRLVLGGGLSSGVANTVPIVHGLQLGLRPTQSNGGALTVSALRAEDGALAEWHLHLDGGWLWSLGHGPVRAWWGVALGSGLLIQDVTSRSARYSPLFEAGPVLGLTSELNQRLGLWSELTSPGRLFRRDAQWAVALAPSAWLGAFLSL
jgi:caspase domain-containing protein